MTAQHNQGSKAFVVVHQELVRYTCLVYTFIPNLSYTHFIFSNQLDGER